MDVCTFVRVYTCLYHTCSHWHRHAYTQYTYITCIQRDTCVHVPWFIQTHTWVAARVVLSVWMCVRVYMCITMCMFVCVYVSISYIYTLTQTHHTQFTYTTYMQRNTCVHVPQFMHSYAWAVTHADCVYGCVYVCICGSKMCVYVYVCTRVYIIHVHIDTDTHEHNTCEQHAWKETHVYMYHDSCTMIHTSTHMSGRSCSLVCMDVCTCVSRCVYVCVSIYLCHALHIDTDANTQCTNTTYMQKDTCAIVTQFIQTHYMSGRSCSLVCMDMCTFVDMCHTVCTYVCVCICIYIIHLHLDTRTCMYNTCINVT